MDLLLPQDAAGIAARILEDVRRMSPDSRGVSRPAYSAIETQVLDYLSDFAAAHGLDVEEDAARNRLFSLPCDRGADSWTLVGSHVDSVPEGGNFDGLAGVVAGLLVLIGAATSGVPLRNPTRCIALRAEESAWFGACYLASRALTGQLGRAELDGIHRGDGRPLSAHMADLGIDIDRIARGQPLCNPARIIEYLELHIEQGPLLVERIIPAAVVTGIRGNIRYRDLRCIGEAGHSGAVPRGYRHDPVLGMADLLTGLDRMWDEMLARGDDLVLTAGMVATDAARHAMSRIADDVVFSLDIRSLSAATLEEMRARLIACMEDIARKRGVRFETGPEIPTNPAEMDGAVVAGLMQAMRRTGQLPFAMASGGGHDAAIFAQAGVPAGMVFVRNRNGSHNPNEAMDIDDLLAGTRILAAYLANPPETADRRDLPMFDILLRTLNDQGRSIHGYRAVSALAWAHAQEDPAMAAAWALLAVGADDFVERFERMPLSSVELNSAFARFSREIETFDAAACAGDPAAMLQALNAAAQRAAARHAVPLIA